MRNCGSCGGTLVRVRRKFLQKFAYHAILLCKSCGRTEMLDRKSTRLNSSHLVISYAVFCLKKKKTTIHSTPPYCSGGHYDLAGLATSSSAHSCTVITGGLLSSNGSCLRCVINPMYWSSIPR